MEAQGSWLTNKYAEGLPGRRYYGGCECVDVVERLARERALALFPGAEHVNVQPHSGAQANLAAYFAVLEPGDRILGMSLAHGGHLTHGSPSTCRAGCSRSTQYGVDPGPSASTTTPWSAGRRGPAQAAVAGASAYPRDHRLRAPGRHRPTGRRLSAGRHRPHRRPGGGRASTPPFPHADLVTTTTHKTLRGPRGGLIFCSAELAKAIDKAVFPGSRAAR